MKYILLLRHAKSSKGRVGSKDFERPLARRGKKDATRLGIFLKDIKALPNIILSSPAKRAKQTTELVIKAAGLDTSAVNWEEDLYYGGTRNYLTAIQNSPEHANRILLVGHNPLLEETASLLCNNEGSFIVRMPPGALVCLEHPALEWKQIKPGTARIKWMITPSLLKEMKK